MGHSGACLSLTSVSTPMHGPLDKIPPGDAAVRTCQAGALTVVSPHKDVHGALPEMPSKPADGSTDSLYLSLTADLTGASYTGCRRRYVSRRPAGRLGHGQVCGRGDDSTRLDKLQDKPGIVWAPGTTRSTLKPSGAMSLPAPRCQAHWRGYRMSSLVLDSAPSVKLHESPPASSRSPPVDSTRASHSRPAVAVASAFVTYLDTTSMKRSTSLFSLARSSYSVFFTGWCENN